MKYVELFGTDISSDIAEIREKLAQTPRLYSSTPARAHCTTT